MKYTALDIETVGLKPYGGTIWIVATNDGKKLNILSDHNGLAKIPAATKKLLASKDVCKVIHSSEFDVPYLELNADVEVNNIWDTRLAEIIILGVQVPRGNKNEKVNEKYSASLKYTLKRYGFPTLDKSVITDFIGRPKGIPFTPRQIKYAGDDVKYLLPLREAQEFLLKRDGLLEVALLEMLVAKRIATMRVRGIGFDSDVWHTIAVDNMEEFKNRMEKLPDGINWNSPKQVKEYFASRGVLIDSLSDVEKIQRDVNNSELANFIAARELHKSTTAYGLNWFHEGYIDADQRVRPNVSQIINSGRMAFSNPNLQQLPSAGRHRAAFVPAKGHVFVIGDFSGQEIGIMAAASGEKIWIDAMLRGDDIHALTASLLYADLWRKGKEKGCAFPAKCKCKVHHELRQHAKVLNFMLAYGGGAQNFSYSTGVSLKASKEIIFRYKRVIPKLTRWLAKNGDSALKTGVSYSADPYKRRRVLRGVEGWQIENQGKNNPIQSAGANMLKLAMASLPESLHIVLVVHDEIVLEVPKAEAKSAAKTLKMVMEKSANYITGIKGLIKVAPTIQNNLLKQ